MRTGSARTRAASCRATPPAVSWASRPPSSVTPTASACCYTRSPSARRTTSWRRTSARATRAAPNSCAHAATSRPSWRCTTDWASTACSPTTPTRRWRCARRRSNGRRPGGVHEGVVQPLLQVLDRLHRQVLEDLLPGGGVELLPGQVVEQKLHPVAQGVAGLRLRSCVVPAEGGGEVVGDQLDRTSQHSLVDPHPGRAPRSPPPHPMRIVLQSPAAASVYATGW